MNTTPILTHGGDAISLSEQLDYEDMVALSGLFRLWAIYEDQFSPDSRTFFIAFSADLEELAEWVGVGWRATGEYLEPTFLKFVATYVRKNGRNVINFQQAKRALEC